MNIGGKVISEHQDLIFLDEIASYSPEKMVFHLLIFARYAYVP